MKKLIISHHGNKTLCQAIRVKAIELGYVLSEDYGLAEMARKFTRIIIGNFQGSEHTRRLPATHTLDEFFQLKPEDVQDNPKITELTLSEIKKKLNIEGEIKIKEES